MTGVWLDVKCHVCGERFEAEKENIGGSCTGGLSVLFKPVFYGPFGTTHPDNGNKDFRQLFGIHNQREGKQNWICGACLAEKLGIEEDRKPRGGMF